MTKTPRISVRIHPAMWDAFAELCRSRGTTPSESIRKYVERMITRHGTPEQQDALRQAKAEERRLREEAQARRAESVRRSWAQRRQS